MDVLHSLDGLLVTNPTNIRYLTGFAGAAPEEREAYAFITIRNTYLFTNSIYIEQAKKLAKIELIETSREHPIVGELKKLCRALNIKKLGFEEANLTVTEFNSLRTAITNVKLIPTKNRIEEMRQIKRPDEIANIRLAVSLTDQCFKFITRRLRPGITESRLALEIEGFIRSRGGENAFSPIVAFNEHSSQPHYQARSFNPLRRGSIILLDFGARINGYCADMTRVIFIGKPKDEWVVAYNAVLKAQHSALTYLKDCYHDSDHDSRGEQPKVSGATLDRGTRSVITDAGLPAYSHSLGHNIGLDVHEGPRLSIKKDEQLLPGMVFSVEPGVYVEGQYGIRIEDLVRLTNTGVEILTKSPKELIIL